MASPIVARIIALASRLGAKPQKFTGSRTNISFLGTGPSDELFSQALRINEMPGLFVKGTGNLKPAILSKVDSAAGYAMAGKLSQGQLKTLEGSLKAMDSLKLGMSRPTGIVNTESFRELGRRGAKGSEFKELGQRLAKQKKNRFPGNVTPEVKSALKEIDNKIVASGQITMKDFAKLSEIEKNRIRRVFEPGLEELFPFLKFAGGGMVPESFGLANILAV